MTEEVTSGLSDLSGYELYDMVAISNHEMGVVVAVGAEKLSVMTHMGIVKQVTLCGLDECVKS